MKGIYLIIAFTVSCVWCKAQQDYFVFIQQVSGEPFYVRMGEESYSSSANGHLILSRLKDSTYQMFIGFPKGRNAEQLFTVPVNKKDRGFELKQIDGQWQLFDLQSLQLMRPVAGADNSGLTKKEDSYSRLMAGVVDDTAVLYSTAAEREEVKNEKPTRPVPKGVDTAVKAGAKAALSADTAKQTASAPPVRSSGRDKRDIIRYSTENIVEGKLMIYLDRTSEVTDTIRIIVPRL